MFLPGEKAAKKTLRPLPLPLPGKGDSRPEKQKTRLDVFCEQKPSPSIGGFPKTVTGAAGETAAGQNRK